MIAHEKGKVRAVVIDNGLNQRIYNELTGKKIKAYHIENSYDLVENGDAEYCDLSHGTLCTALLTEFTEDAEIISISLTDGGRPPLFHFEAAVLWCLNHSVDLICMSMGVTSWLEINPFLPLFECLAKNNIIVVAAASNDGWITYPSSLSSVLGVRYCKHDSEGRTHHITLIDNPVDGTDIETDLPKSSVLQRLKDIFHLKTISNSNSMAAPYIAAKLIELIGTGYPHNSLAEVRQSLVSYMNVEVRQGKTGIDNIVDEKAHEDSGGETTQVNKDNTAFASHSEFLLDLKNLEFPVIALVYELEQEHKATELVLSLQHLLFKNGFNAVIFSPVLERSIEKNIFQMNETKLEKELAGYSKLIRSDLVLFHLSDSALTSIQDRSFIDYMIEYDEKFMMGFCIECDIEQNAYNVGHNAKHDTEHNTERNTECHTEHNTVYNTESPVDIVEVQAELIYNKVIELFYSDF